MAKTILLVHGAWVTPACWDLFRVRLEGSGYTTLAPAWPGVEGLVGDKQSNPPAEFAQLTVTKLVDHFASIVRGLPEPPVLVGHSFGGLVVQRLLDLGLGASGVAIDPAPARGVLPSWGALRLTLTVAAAWAFDGPLHLLTQEQFERWFAHTLTPEELEAVYRRHIIPAPRRLIWQSAVGVGNGVDFGNRTRAPLLLISGEEDRTVTLQMVKRTWKKYQRSGATTELRSFPGRTHWLIASPGWQDVADAVIEWARENAR